MKILNCTRLLSWVKLSTKENPFILGFGSTISYLLFSISKNIYKALFARYLQYCQSCGDVVNMLATSVGCGSEATVTILCNSTHIQLICGFSLYNSKFCFATDSFFKIVHTACVLSCLNTLSIWGWIWKKVNYILFKWYIP